MDLEKTRKFRNNKQSVHLPQEIIEEILSRLAVKPLLRLRCVSKSWRTLITSKRFIKTQLQNSTKKTSLAHQRVIFFSKRGAMKQCSLQSLLNETEIYPTDIDSPTNNHLERSRVVGCCNGLLCLLNYFERCFVLWNPATRISIQLPKLDLSTSKYGFALDLFRVKYGFGFDEKSGAYKVFAFVYDNKLNRVIGKVYSTNSNSWKTVKTEREDFIQWPHGAGQFLCGKIHWFNNKGHDIESIDLESEEFGRIELSFGPFSWVALQLGAIGGCLSVVCDHHFKNPQLDVWVMKEYGVKDSWFKMFTVPLVQLKLPIDHPYKYSGLNPLLGEGPNGEILLMYMDRFLVYCSKDNKFSAAKTIKSLEEFVDAQVYVESLVSPGCGQLES